MKRTVLETRTSGEAVSLSEFGGQGESLMPVRTYKSVSGHWCREYVRDIMLEGRTIGIRGVACRTGEGEWVTVKAEPVEGKGA